MPDLTTIKLSIDTADAVRRMATWLLGGLRRVARHPSDPAPGDWQARSTAYRDFQHAIVPVVLDLQTLAVLGTPPRLRGAVWTWPTALRLAKRVPDGFRDSMSSVSAIALVGDGTVLDAALAVAESLAELAATFPERRRGGSLPPAFGHLVEHTMDLHAEFVRAARLDLQKKD